MKSFLEHFCPEKLLYVDGSPEKRVMQVLQKLAQIRKPS